MILVIARNARCSKVIHPVAHEGVSDDTRIAIDHEFKYPAMLGGPEIGALERKPLGHFETGFDAGAKFFVVHPNNATIRRV